MLERLTAVEFVRSINTGRTCPAILNCEMQDGSMTTVVAKFSDYCDEGPVNLCREVVAGCLAGDLGLPIPRPYLIDIPSGWVDVIPDPVRRARIAVSLPVAFGSSLVTGGYSTWTADTRISEGMLAPATAIFAFDAIVQNVDRRVDNPNCLVRGEEIRIVDHELAFAHKVVIGWRPPWAAGGLNWLERKGTHIFLADLRRSGMDLAGVRERWATIGDERIGQYGAALPAEWNAGAENVKDALELIRGAREHIDSCLSEIGRVLT